MMFVGICICYKYYFQEFELKINPLTLKATLNHKHYAIKGFTSQNPMKRKYNTYFYLLVKIIYFIILPLTMDFSPLSPPPS